MPTIKQHAAMMAAGAALAAMIFATPTAASYADPGDGNSSTSVGTGSPAAAPSPGDGKGSPSYDVPVSIPSVTASNPEKPKDLPANATPAEKAEHEKAMKAYDAAKAEYDRQVSANANAKSAEYARQQAQRAKAAAEAAQHQGAGGAVPSKPWCPNNAASCPGNR
ncbi:hypothetical protein FK529_05380 [Tsukamurella asaccharolytica]|uniref:Uncharacterized protein n=1 Tax=Tsukamurella asaccharolytica TaxID=2592067 RepID=A0A5C5RF78_9ACTN|nr:hypothetical protein [Tsukamurella asaccharolytica]TWS20761.1 hypothetical protein FK529_05380 [Tsukamurella asaccharolytica]